MGFDVTEADSLAAAADIAEVLEALHVPYVIGGSLASMLHGVRRLTDDVDVAIALDAWQVDALANALPHDFVVGLESIREAVRARSSFNAIHKATWTRMDVYVRSRDGHFAEQLRRAPRITLNRALDQYARFASAEDIVLEKLRWYERGGRVSEKQWSDVRGVLKLQAERLDLGYLRAWAARLGVVEALERALVESGLAGSPRA